MDYPSTLPAALRRTLADLYRADETALAETLLTAAQLTPSQLEHAERDAQRWIETIRNTKKSLLGVAEMLSHFGLNTREGTALMCLAEALLRIPDAATADALIRDKLTSTDFDTHLGTDSTWLLRAAGWTLNLTGKIVAEPDQAHSTPSAMLGLLNNRLGHGAVREAVRHAMGWLGNQFVLGTDIHNATKRASKLGTTTARFSYDMLGEAARTAADVDHYYSDYLKTIAVTGATNRAHPQLAPSGISVKLSALHPRYEAAQAERVYDEMVPRLIALAEAAAHENIFMIIDAEEADRLVLSLNVLERTLMQAKLGNWEGLGLAVQAYSKRAGAVIDAAATMAAHFKRRMIVRLIKGAYWDTEIKRAQERGWSDFPVFTRKLTTDVSYLACAKQLLTHSAWLSPVFGSHNALTIASIIAIAPKPDALEFQRLQGMGEELFNQLEAEGYRTCVYAPVGNHEILLGYLVRRLLENGANSSFVNQLSDPRIPLTSLTANPVAKLAALANKRHPKVILPIDLFAPERVNSSGLDLTDATVTTPLLTAIATTWQQKWSAAPLIKGISRIEESAHPIYDPSQQSRIVGQVHSATPEQVKEAFAVAQTGFATWRQRSANDRATTLEQWADHLHSNQAALIALLGREAGKTINDAVAEVREAIDFCRYYAARARIDCVPHLLPGVTGERNELHLQGRGVFGCISPWNFPLAIFVGQIAAALAVGNSVVAKPAPQTPLIAAFACHLALQAGIPDTVLQLLLGDASIGAELIAHPNLAGIAFTGSVATAKTINRTLANKTGAIIPFIAETGGQNALIVDSTALPEQVIDDVITSAFRSAGQRCSALRLLCVPHATADKITTMLKASMQELVLGDPLDLTTDIGPVIDKAACERLHAHSNKLRAHATEHYSLPLPHACTNGTFFGPQLWEIPTISVLTEEVFGPILHIVRYHPAELSQLITDINATGFGLTGGVHSRIAAMTEQVTQQLHVGNLYINRSTIGAVVGCQPFGGVGLSGTGPKAGGPHYLPRFGVEYCISTNTTAAGGNASLMAAAGED
jgi:RHH-type proline utilization regulon transcriptional repressor/proline dehydrogenase/delta 1-pyrroline-5-carboxylate dehydrogenase